MIRILWEATPLGKYQVIKSEEDLITIQYFGESGNETGNTRAVTFTIDRRNDTLVEGTTIMTRKNWAVSFRQRRTSLRLAAARGAGTLSPR